MSNILAYPAIPEVSEADLLIISDISEDGNPTRTVSVQALVGGSTAPLGLTVNGTSGAATLIDNILNIPIYTGGGGGTVTNVTYSTNINAFAASVTNSSSSPDITLTLNGGSAGQFLQQDGEWATVPSGGGTMSQWFVDDGGGGGFPVTNNNNVLVSGTTKILVSTNTALKSITWTHTDTARTDTTSTASPAAGATFTVVDSITQDATGHPTAVNVKTVTMPAGGGGGVSSIGLSTDITAFTILNSPITTAGILQINKNGGVAGQYLNQDGTWQYGIFKKDANDGIYISDRTPANYGAIGANSFDTSFSTNATGVNGAVGDHSAAFGENNKTTQDWAFVTGKNNTVALSTGEGSSFVFGKDNTTNLSASIIGGYNNNATVAGLPANIPTGQVILGRSNTMGSNGLGNVIIGKDNSMPSGSGVVIGDSNSITSTSNYLFGKNNNASNGTAVALVGIGNTMNGSGYAFGSSNNITTSPSSPCSSYGSNNQITGNSIQAYGHGLVATQNFGIYIGSSIAHSSGQFRRIIMPSIITMPSYANDTAAAAGGVVVGELYRDGSTIKIRVT